jgi:hypothetical protein
MSRTIAEIYDSLNTVKNNMTELKGYVTETSGTDMDTANNLALDAESGSKVAKWRLWLWIVAVASWLIENIVGSGELSLQAIINGQRPHNLRWYEEETNKWQYGHEIEWIDNDHWGYMVDDETARLVSAVSATQSGNGEVTIKAVKLVMGVLTPLTTLEKSSLEAFWAKWKDAGVEIVLVSAQPNQLELEATIVRDRLILDSDNTLLRNSSIYPITDAFDDYLEAVPFNGVIRITDIEQAVKQAEGIKDFVISSLSISPDGGVFTLVDREVVPTSGFANLLDGNLDFTYIDE